MKRFAMGRGSSRRSFTRHAMRKSSVNFRGAPMRGGIRL